LRNGKSQSWTQAMNPPRPAFFEIAEAWAPGERYLR